jgi:glycosyltransferase involved in cell wall biosynthesis
MRILWFNWRDIEHPDAGGAEVLTHEVMKRLVQHGYDMTLFCPKVEGRSDSEVLDGIKIIRKGGKYTVYHHGRNYFKRNYDKYDLVIDEVNPRPFLNPKVLNGKPSLVLFHQLIREEWFYEMPFPISYFCHFYENKWLLPYKNTRTLTVSESSKMDLEKIGFKNVKVIPMGVSIAPLNSIPPKEKDPTVVFIGRLKKHKLPDHAIKAFSILKKDLPSAKLWVIGNGYMLDRLKKSIPKGVSFFGHVENSVKYNLLSRAHIVLIPSIREGWGLIVIEANAMGTPVAAYNVNGLRDSVVDGENGILIGEKSPESLAKNVLKLLNDKELLYKLSKLALEHSRHFSWENTTDFFISEIDNLL